VRARRFLFRARIAFLRAIPPPLRTRAGRAALRAASLAPPQREALRRNLREILEPETPLEGAGG